MTPEYRLKQAKDFIDSAMRMLERCMEHKPLELGILYGSTEQLHQAEREINRAIGMLERE